MIFMDFQWHNFPFYDILSPMNLLKQNPGEKMMMKTVETR